MRRSSRGLITPTSSVLAVCLACLAACSQNNSSTGQTGGAGSGGSRGGAGGGSAGTGGTLTTGGSQPTGGTVTSGGVAAGGTGGAAGSGGEPIGSGGVTGGTGGVVGGTKAPGGSGGSAEGGNRDAGPVDAAGAGGSVDARGGAAGSTDPVGGAGGKGGTAGTAGTGGSSPETCSATTFKNPVIFEDLPDNDIIRMDNVFYLSASSFHFSPGAPILRSYDLVNWEYIGHSVPALDFNNKYSLNGGYAYNDGVWASSLRYRKSNNTYYWIGCMHGQGGGYVYTAPAIEGPWTKHATPFCYYDVGLLIDDDDMMYTAYGNTTISVAQLSKDGFTQVKTQVVHTSGSEGTLEGSRFYKIKGYYYIMPTPYANGEYILRASSPFGPYELRKFAVKLTSPITPEPTTGGAPHQGSIVDTPSGDWYYMAFIDAYPGGRIPVLAPITWTDGWPSVNVVNGGWGLTYPYPKGLPCTPVKPRTGTGTFSEKTLGHDWEWNHNPDNTKWSTGDGLTLQTATLTTDLYAARNTLTHRVLGPISTATIALDYSNMKDGDVAGLALLRQTSAWIGVKKSGGATKVVMTNGLTMTSSFATASTGTEVASAAVSGGKIWLRVTADITPGSNRQGKFSYSTDGSQFTPLGNALTLDKTWNFFMGHRYAIFNYATQALGGSINVSSFQMTTP